MTRDWLADSGHEIMPVCPACYPAKDPSTYVVTWCGDHRPSVAGSDDPPVPEWITGSAEAGGSSNRAICEQVHRSKETDK